MAFLRLLVREPPARFPPGRGKDAVSELRPRPRFVSPVSLRHQACPWRHKLVSPAIASAPVETRRSLRAHDLVIVRPAAGTLGRRQFTVGPPGKQPGLHVLVPDVVTGLYLAVCLADFSQQSLLVGYVGFDRIGDEEVRTAPGNLGQFSQPFLGLRFQADAQGRTTCVRHEHIVSRWFTAPSGQVQSNPPD